VALRQDPASGFRFQFRPWLLPFRFSGPAEQLHCLRTGGDGWLVVVWGQPVGGADQQLLAGPVEVGSAGGQGGASDAEGVQRLLQRADQLGFLVLAAW
jgi:hypothetical protein